MSFIKIPTKLLQADISPAQFRLCAYIIANSVYNSKLDVTACFCGYEIIARDLTGKKSAKSSTIKLINDLINKGILIHRGRSGNKSNGIAFNENFDLGRGQNQGCLNSAPEPFKRCLNVTDGCLNVTDGCLNVTDGCLNVTPHKDIKFKNINLKYLNTYEAEGCLNSTPENMKAPEKETAPADVAADRSKPKDESARKAEAEDWAAKDALMSQLLTRIYPEFKSWYSLYRNANGGYQINPVSSLIERIMPEKARITSVPEGVTVCNWETPGRGLTKIL